MSEQLVSPADLEWWTTLASQLEWTFAKTYAKTAPHEYVVLGRTEGITREDFIRAAHAIHTFGQPGKFYKSTNIYLTVDGWKYWTMDWNLDETDLINRVTPIETYGKQDAPETFNPNFTRYDAVATRWDKTRPTHNDRRIKQTITRHFGAYAPTTLDVGCGTGWLLDQHITAPGLYTGVDPSQAMLNALVRKHPGVHAVHPNRLSELRLGRQYELVLAQNLADELTDHEHVQLKSLAADLLVVT
jgi:hypothetical protein